jgi:hypothetical protein
MIKGIRFIGLSLFIDHPSSVRNGLSNQNFNLIF